MRVALKFQGTDVLVQVGDRFRMANALASIAPVLATSLRSEVPPGHFRAVILTTKRAITMNLETFPVLAKGGVG